MTGARRLVACESSRRLRSPEVEKGELGDRDGETLRLL
jgi:hypothetical protein